MPCDSGRIVARLSSNSMVWLISTAVAVIRTGGAHTLSRHASGAVHAGRPSVQHGCPSPPQGGGGGGGRHVPCWQVSPSPQVGRPSVQHGCPAAPHGGGASIGSWCGLCGPPA